jgi:predicted nucleic acid-binding protein
MIIVSDTTPLRYLIEIEKAHILESLFEKIVIPQAVFNDLQRPKTPQPVKEWIVNHPAWLEVRQADLSLYTPRKRIGDGEREAFALALELQADAVLLDDKGAMVEAKRLGLVTIRTFDILRKGCKRELD